VDRGFDISASQSSRLGVRRIGHGPINHRAARHDIGAAAGRA
jgi:hypothetical protein